MTELRAPGRPINWRDVMRMRNYGTRPSAPQADFLTTSLSYPMHPWRQICRRARQQRIPPPGPYLSRGTIFLDLHCPVRLYHLDGLIVLRITLYSRSTLYLYIRYGTRLLYRQFFSTSTLRRGFCTLVLFILLDNYNA